MFKRSRFTYFARSVLLALAALLLPSLSLAAGADDTVFLKNGGRARGQVVEEDPTAGVTLQLPDGTFRRFKAHEIARVEYARQAQPSAAPAAAGDSAGLLGTLRVESSEPGTLSVDGADYGPLPQTIPRLAAGPHRVSVSFLAGDSVTRMVGVRAEGETVASFEPTPSLDAFKLHKGLHFGGGVIGGIALVDGDDAAKGLRVFGRAAYAFTRVCELNADLMLGGFADQIYRDSSGYDSTITAFGIALRVDLQLNWGSIYTLDFGLDAGIIPVSENTAFVGAHASILGFRFGEKREFLLSMPVTLLAMDEGVLEFGLSLGYTLL